VEDRGADVTEGIGGSGDAAASPASIALHALVEAVERRLRGRGVGGLPDAFLLGEQRHAIIDALQRGLLDFVAVVDWPTFHRLSPVLSRKGFDGVRATVALSLAPALQSGVTAEVLETLDYGVGPRPRSVLFGRLTRATAGHVFFRSQLLVLAEGECATTPLEMTGWLERHTPAAIRAMLQGRLIKSRPDLTGEPRQCLIDHATRHLGRLLPEAESSQHTLRLLRLAYYRLHYPAAARPVLRRLRVVDFRARRAGAAQQARPSR
jgi:hypothetical protein